jgi:hypothetical protein
LLTTATHGVQLNRQSQGAKPVASGDLINVFRKAKQYTLFANAYIFVSARNDRLAQTHRGLDRFQHDDICLKTEKLGKPQRTPEVL